MNDENGIRRHTDILLLYNFFGHFFVEFFCEIFFVVSVYVVRTIPVRGPGGLILKYSSYLLLVV